MLIISDLNDYEGVRFCNFMRINFKSNCHENVS